MGVVTLCLLLLPHEGRRALSLGRLRHAAPVTASLLVTALPPLVEAGFYRALALGRRRALGSRRCSWRNGS